MVGGVIALALVAGLAGFLLMRKRRAGQNARHKVSHGEQAC